jgi:hypothetical protein
MMLVPLLALLTAASPNLLANPNFEDGIVGWCSSSPTIRMEGVMVDERHAAHIVVPPTAEIAYPHLFQEIESHPGDILEASVYAMAHGVTQGHGAYMTIEYHGGGKRLLYSQSSQAFHEDRWCPLKVSGVAPPGTTHARLTLILNGHGEALFGDACFMRTTPEPLPSLEGPITLKVTSEVACDGFLGFGAEDDGWFYNRMNADHGVDEKDIALREARIEWMDPDFVRMFFWPRDWCPSDDWETFTFDSPNMQSHYRTLDLYQRIGATVDVTGVEWGMKDPYSDPAKFAHALGELMGYLIRSKGYTCIRYWTLSNEPNGAFHDFGYSFDHFVRIHTAVKEEFSRRGLAVKIVGSDDAQSVEWYRECVSSPAYYDAVDVFSSHRYFLFPETAVIPSFFRDRLEPLALRTPRKPFILGEFGFHDAQSGVVVNPLMKTYPYAVWAADLAIEGLNQGVSAFSIWCLHEVYYPGGAFMTYALWDYKDNDWKPRPVYYAWSNFSRLTEAGDKVVRVDSSDPRRVRGAQVGGTLFWVNLSGEPAEVVIQGFEAGQVRIQTENTLEGDRECGAVKEIEDGRFNAPPMSFGYALGK